MNFLRGNVVNEGAAVRIVGDGWSLPLTPRNARRALASSGEVIAGARHTHIRISPVQTPDALPAQVYTTEPTGDLTFVHLRVGQHLVVASVDPSHAFAPDDRVWLSFDQDQLHLFDAATEQALIVSDGPVGTVPAEATSLTRTG